MEQRSKSRRVPTAGESLGRLRMRLGPELDVLDISDSGALVEGSVRLAPGARLDVHVITRGGRVLVRCRVMRAFACFVACDSIRFRGAIAFDEPVDSSPGYQVPATFQSSSRVSGSRYPDEPTFAGEEREK